MIKFILNLNMIFLLQISMVRLTNVQPGHRSHILCAENVEGCVFYYYYYYGCLGWAPQVTTAAFRVLDDWCDFIFIYLIGLRRINTKRMLNGWREEGGGGVGWHKVGQPTPIKSPQMLSGSSVCCNSIKFLAAFCGQSHAHPSRLTRPTPLFESPGAQPDSFRESYYRYTS